MKSQLKKLTAIFLSICVVLSLTSIISFAAETKTYTFSSYTAGTQYGKNEVHELDSNLTVVTNNCYFTSELRIYSSNTSNGYAILKTAANKCFSGLKFNAGNKKDTLNVYGSNDEGATWTLIQGVAITSTSYKDYTVSGTFTDNAGNPYTWLKLDVAGTNQVRIAKMTVTFVDAPSGGDDTSSTPSEGESSSSTPSTPDDDEDPSSGTTSTPTESASAYYEKVTEAPSDWSGEYLIVYEAGNKAYNGALTDLKATNSIAVSISNNKIEATETVNAAKFVIAAIDGGYSIKSASGYYIGRTSANTQSNDLLFSTSTQYVNAISMSGTDVDIVSGNTYLRWNNSSSFFRYYRASTYTGQGAIALYKYVEVPAGSIKGANIEVGTDLTANFYADVTKLTDPKMTFALGTEEAGDPVGVATDANGSYFAFEGIPPHYMTETITATLYDGDKVVTTLTKTIKDIAMAYLNGDYADKVKTFAANMLNYGAASQNYMNKNTDKLANSDVDGYGTTNAPDASVAEGIGLSNNAGYIKSANVWFDNKNSIIVKFQNLPENAKLIVKKDGVQEFSGLASESYKTNGLLATELDAIYTFTIQDAEGEELQSLTYSVNYYTYAKSTSSSMGALAIALYNYGASAELVK